MTVSIGERFCAASANVMATTLGSSMTDSLDEAAGAGWTGHRMNAA